MDNFKFNEKEHVYSLNDKPLPSVTQIVSNVLNTPMFANEWYLKRGSMIHLAIKLFLNNKLDENSVDPRIQGYFMSAKSAIKDLKIQPALIETHLYHKLLLFAGTPDLLTSEKILIDWKSGSQQPHSIFQLGGYISLLETVNYPVKKAYEIVLSEKNYKIFEYKPRYSKNLFLAAHSIYSWKNGGGK